MTVQELIKKLQELETYDHADKQVYIQDEDGFARKITNVSAWDGTVWIESKEF